MNTSILNKAMLLPFICSFISCQNPEIKEELHQIEETSNTIDSVSEKSSIQSKTFINNDSLGGWGYDIMFSGSTYIHQTNVPAISGTRGFNSKEDAQKVADLVISKIKKSSMPPSITLKELDSLKIIK